MALKGKRILVGLTGGIACYKVPYLIRHLTRDGCEVRVVMTAGATNFITPLTLETVSNHPVETTLFPIDEFVGTRHIDIANWPDLVVIAPATANFIGKVAGGICDDLLTTIVCASPRPFLIAPAMNPNMWQHPPTQKNVTYLKSIGYHFVGPDTGDMACDQWGEGRMVEPEVIFGAIKDLLAGTPKKKALENKKILVTAGPCREPIDPVRYISNRSSGKMGLALAVAARDLGAEVTLVAGPILQPPPAGIETVQVESTEEMYRAVSSRFAKADCLIMAAAPADFTPVAPSAQKIKKAGAPTSIDLKPTVDILSQLGSRKKKQLLIGFALETEHGVENARRKLKAKNLDMIVLNSPRDPQSGFEHDTNQVTLLRPGRRPEPWSLMPKVEVAAKLLELIARML
jgi:phosphopantothenoylcysteine decarboxylase/phosphopantothenate--cysteine ligase